MPQAGGCFRRHLAVGIAGNDPVAAGGVQAREQGEALSLPPVVPLGAQMGVDALERGQAALGMVLTAVIDDDQFDLRGGVEGRGQGSDKRGQVAGFVIRRNDDGELGNAGRLATNAAVRLFLVGGHFAFPDSLAAPLASHFQDRQCVFCLAWCGQWGHSLYRPGIVVKPFAGEGPAWPPG